MNSNLQDIEVEIREGFYKPTREKIILPPVVDYSPEKKSIISRKERIMKAWHALSPHSKRMASVTQYTILLGIGLSVVTQSWV